MSMETKGKVLYIGGFELPDNNAAAQRVIGIAKGLRDFGYDVSFLNSLKNYSGARETIEKRYFGFKCLEYPRESNYDYLITAKTCISNIRRLKPDLLIAYNYPGFALERVRNYCAANNIRCFADATEWYQAISKNPFYRFLKNVDTKYRMKIVYYKLDGVIAISRFLYKFYKNSVRTVMIPPTVDITDSKWGSAVKKKTDQISFVYAGSPSAQKERLDLIVKAVEELPGIKNPHLNILGVTKEQFKRIYDWEKPITDRIVFWGCIEHTKAIEIIKQSDWSIILRDNNFVVNAGFPTKVVESVSCGTPVIANRFSNISDYIGNGRNGVLVEDLHELSLERIISNAKVTMDINTFDYRSYISQIIKLIE